MSHLSPKQLAVSAGYSSRQVQRALSAGEIPESFRTRGGHWRIPTTAGLAWASRMRRHTEPPAAVTSPTPATVEEFVEDLPADVGRISQEVRALYCKLWGAGRAFVEQAGLDEVSEQNWINRMESKLPASEYFAVYRATVCYLSSTHRPPNRSVVSQFRELWGSVHQRRKNPRRKRKQAERLQPVDILAFIRRQAEGLPDDERRNLGEVLKNGLFGGKV